jgi:hypothetical protein
MAVNLSMLAGAGAQFFTDSGVILSGGLVYTYAAGTTTPQTTYTTSAGNVAHTNPIVLNSAGRVASGGEIWLTDAVSYKFVLQTSTAVTIATYDNVTGNSSGIYAAFAASSGSSLVGYTQGGAGAVATTVQTKLRETVSVKDFGAVGDGTTNDTAAIQAAHDAAQGKKLYFPKGKYKLTSTITNTYTNPFWYGDVGDRYVDGGTEISSSALVLFKNGVDNGNPWENADYDGPQGMVFQDLWFTNSAPDTNLSGGGSGGSTQKYKAGSYAIQDWRGGSVELRGRVGFERFEYSFWGINSDINNFENVYQLYCKYGIYAGPRSDQFTIKNFYPIYCDTAIIIDAATDVRILNPQIVNCGTVSQYAIDIRCGSGQVVIENGPWFEHLNGYIGTSGAAFVGAGMNNGWIGTTSGGGNTNTTPVQGLVIRNPFIYTTVNGAAYHTNYLVDVGYVLDLFLDSPEPPSGQNLNIDSLFNFNNSPQPGAKTTSTTTAFARIHQRDLTKLYGSFTGTPEVGYQTFGFSGNIIGNTNGRLYIDRVNGSAGSDRMQIGSENVTGQLLVDFPNMPTYQTARLKLLRSMQQASSIPTTGTWQQGDIVFNTSPANAAGQPAGWLRITTGSGNVLNTDWRVFGVTT